jgi:hypothetical protein
MLGTGSSNPAGASVPLFPMTTSPASDAATQAASQTRRRVNWPLLLIAGFMAPVGVQAALFPRSFFDDFPVGRGWIAATRGAYNEHLVRDVGVLFIALVIATAWTVWSRQGDRPVAVAWIVQGVAHLVFHTRHLHDLTGLDRAALLGSLAVIPVLAALALRYPTNR